MIIKKSYALKKFKKEVGQANHMLITIMVGLDGIITYNVDANPEFRVSWNPKNKKSSVDRSKLFAKKSALAWIVDCIDMYLRIINQSPTMINDNELKKQIDSEENSRSVYKRIRLICDFYEIKSVDYAIIDLLICWRNRLIHYQAENDISDNNKNLLKARAIEIKLKYSGLDINRTLASFSETSFPTFKEIAAFIKSSIDLIYEIDAQLVKHINLERYADQVLIKYFQQNEMRRLNNIFSKDLDTKVKSLRQILSQQGFYDVGNKNEVDELYSNISHLSFDMAKKKYRNGTFI